MTLPLDAILNILDQECQEGNFHRPPAPEFVFLTGKSSVNSALAG